MKRRLLSLLTLIAVTIMAVSARDTVTRDINTLPGAARTCLTNNFKAQVSFIKIDKTLGHIDEYEVVLTDGSEVTFDRNGNWKEVEAPRGKAVPAGFTPDTLRRWLKANHKGARIVSVERKGNNIEVELSTDVELLFGPDGSFIKYT